jgi:hypothetical protein
MKRRKYYILGILVVAAAILVVCFLPSSPPFMFIPEEATIHHLPGQDWVVYVFPADFNNIMSEVETELSDQGFIRTWRGAYDPNERRRYDRTSNGQRVSVQVYNKRLMPSGKQGTEAKWVSVSVNADTVVSLRRRTSRFINKKLKPIRRLIGQLML